MSPFVHKYQTSYQIGDRLTLPTLSPSEETGSRVRLLTYANNPRIYFNKFDLTISSSDPKSLSVYNVLTVSD